MHRWHLFKHGATFQPKNFDLIAEGRGENTCIGVAEQNVVDALDALYGAEAFSLTCLPHFDSASLIARR